MKKIKKIFIGTIFIFLSITSFAQGGTTGTLTWALSGSGSNRTLTISGSGVMPDYDFFVESLRAPWYSYNTYITTVIIGNNVTSIGNDAFRSMNNLTSITIGNSITSIGNYAFYGCNKLTSITIPDNTTTIGNWAFQSCYGLNFVTIGNSVTSIGDYAFGGCYSVSSITIPENVVNIGIYAFTNCYSLQTVNYNAMNCTLMGPNVFSFTFTTFWTLNIGNRVKTIPDNAFSYCKGLTFVAIPDSVTSIGNSAFTGCDSLTSVTIGNGVTNIGNSAFSSCNSLASIIIGDSVTSIGDYAFMSCSSLNSIIIPDCAISIGDNAFYGCSNLSSVTIGNNLTSIGNSAFWGCGNLSSLTIGNSVTSIGNSAFRYCSSLISVTIPDNVTSIGDWAFHECSSLTSVTLGSNITTIGTYAFYGCTILTSIISKAITPPVLSGYVFYGVPTNIPVYVPCGTVSAYQSAPYWNSFTNYQTMGGSAPSQPGTISGLTTVCAGNGAHIYSILAVSGATSYTWTLPTGWTGSSTTTSISATPGSNAQSGNISVTANNDCGSSQDRTLNVTVNTTPAQPGIISGLTTVCAGSGAQNYSISAVSGATTYTWTLPTGWTGSSTTTSISATPGSNAQSGNISVMANSNCGSSQARTLNITVNTTPTQPSTISGATTVCAGSSAQTYSISAISGATSYTWNLPNGWSGSSTNISISATPGANAQSGNISVTANNNCGSSTARTLAVTVNIVPAQPNTISGSTTVCAGSSAQTYSITAVSGATSYTWNLPSGWSGSSTSTSISATPSSNAQSGNISVTANNDCGSGTARILSIVVSAPPVITTSTLPGCITGIAYNQNLTATGTTPITWTLASGTLPADLTLSTAGVISGTPTIAGTSNFTVKAENGCGNDTRTLSIVVTSSAVKPTITTTTLPNGKIGTAYSAQLEATGTASITWSLTIGNLPTGLTLSGSGTISGTPTVIGTFSFTVQASNSAGSATKVLSIKIEDGVGISANEMRNIIIYPNPTTGELRVTSYELQVMGVEIFDVYGRKHESTNTRKHEEGILIDISELASGIYFLRIMTEQGEMVRKVLKE